MLVLEIIVLKCYIQFEDHARRKNRLSYCMFLDENTFSFFSGMNDGMIKCVNMTLAFRTQRDAFGRGVSVSLLSKRG